MRRRLTRAVLPTLLALLAVPAAASAQVGSVSAFPLPGTLTAGTGTQISLRGLPAKRVGRVVVTGSRSGRHRGTLRAHSDGQGASFVLKRKLDQGERVTVRTGLPIRGAHDGDYTFRTARMPKRVTLQNLILENIPAKKTQKFHSRPDLAPPFLTVNVDQPGQAPGDLFFSPKSKRDEKQAGPMIADDSGTVLWFHPLRGIEAATDFRTQTYEGKPVLTYWQGTSRIGIGTGRLVMLDQSYRLIHRISSANGFKPDLHEFNVTPDGKALFITYPIVRWDLKQVGAAKRGLVVDSVIQEVDIATGLVTFEWHSLGKIPITDTFSKPMAPGAPFDYAHANSVNLDSDGNLLMSARNTWTAYKIDHDTGRIMWRLGGKHSSFKLPPDAQFAWQHNVLRRASDGAITVFDNSAFPPVRKFSRALAIQLDEQQRTASLLSATAHPSQLLTATQGNQETLPNGNFLVGWGSQRQATEFSPSGSPLWNGILSLGYESYRSYRLPWVGKPLTRPKVVATNEPGAGTDAYMSWNGATEIATWDLYAGPSRRRLRPVAAVPKRSFETKITAPHVPKYVQVRARDAAGRLLGMSLITRVKGA